MACISSPVSCRAYAKINLGLRVTARRSDGYHEICTVFHRIDLFDDITLRIAEGITVRTTDPAVPSDRSNICHQAALLVGETLGAEAGVRIDIVKRIPAGAGLGGGSADAAAVLLALPTLWDKAVSGSDLRTLALRLGSDVPFFIGGGDTALGTGRGEVLEYFRLDVPFAILLCTPPVHVSTRWAYSQIVPRHAEGNDLRSDLIRGMYDPPLLRSRIVNDFEPCVFRKHPVIGAVKESMEREGAHLALMSGSGSSVYGLFQDEKAARKGAERLRSLNFPTFITPPHFRA
jgi:4-diphosphocytidyl-2-C-methyl-D-erythritol kinase